MATLPPPQQTLWQDLLSTANHHVATGVVAANNQQRNCYWHHWCAFLPPHINPYLQDMPREHQLAILQAFIEWTRGGNLGRGNQVKANSVQDAVTAIGKTFELAGLQNPLYPLHGNKYHLRIARQLESFRRTDPPTRPQLAVPVGIPNWIFRSSQNSQRPQVYRRTFPHGILLSSTCGRIYASNYTVLNTHPGILTTRCPILSKPGSYYP